MYLPRLTILAVLLLVAGCTAAGEPPRMAANEAPRQPRATFQAHLDHLGVPLSLPAEGKAIVVNIPAFELIAFEDARPVLDSRVIVGTPWSPTPRLETHVTAVRFRPTWRPTPSMIASGEYEDRVWPPGERNPLGLAAVRLEDGLLVYLHDTNRRELFAEEQRALSHGCIRVERWDALVAWILDIDLDQVHALAAGSGTRDVPAKPIPVVLGYFPLFPDASGAPRRYEDIYDLGTPAGSSAGCPGASLG